MRITSTITGLLVGAALFGGAAVAQSRPGDCRVRGDLAGQIARCTAIIGDRNVDKVERGVALLYRCQAYDMDRKPDLALADCLTATEMNTDSSTWNSLNIVYRNLGRLEDSLEAANRAIRMSPDKGGYYAGRAATLCRMGQVDRSLSDRLRSAELGYLKVDRIQQLLISRGFYDGQVDGRMTEATRAALRRWTEAGC